MITIDAKIEGGRVTRQLLLCRSEPQDVVVTLVTRSSRSRANTRVWTEARFTDRTAIKTVAIKVPNEAPPHVFDAAWDATRSEAITALEVMEKMRAL